jgi:hypothetical protein
VWLDFSNNTFFFCAIVSHHKISTKKKEEMKGIKTGKVSLKRKKTNILTANLG